MTQSYELQMHPHPSGTKVYGHLEVLRVEDAAGNELPLRSICIVIQDTGPVLVMTLATSP